MILLWIVRILIVIGVFMLLVGLFIWRARKNNDNDANQFPSNDIEAKWKRAIAPPKNLDARFNNGAGFQLYDDDNEEETVASPFAEEIEAILQAKLNADPDLKQYKVNLATESDGGLEILVNGVRYAAIVDIPNNRLRTAFNEAIEAWGKS